MPIRITLNGLSEARGTLPEIPKAIERAVILRMSQIAYDSAQQGAIRHSKTGALVQSLFNRPAGDHGREVGHDLQRAPQALWVNAGTKPHLIRPRNKKALRWASGNGFRFAKVVHHPGYAGDGYIINAATEALRQFTAIVDTATQEAANANLR